jgi:hypothetical protein
MSLRRKRYEPTPFETWCDRMDLHIFREERRAKLAELKARTRKHRPGKPARKGRSAPRSGTGQRSVQQTSA